MMLFEPEGLGQAQDETAPDVGREAGETLDVPAFEEGGRVDRTGIALVHEGEYIIPAPGSEAVISPTQLDDSGVGVVNYYFPVEIEVIGALTDDQVRRIADHVFGVLEAELASRA